MKKKFQLNFKIKNCYKTKNIKFLIKIIFSFVNLKINEI